MNPLDFEEQDDHPDERWLVSYADMMTLLFGLFVLLFSMSSMDKEAKEKVKKSTQQQFGEQTSETEESKIETPSFDEVEALSKKLNATLEALASKEEELKSLSVDFDSLQEKFLQLTSQSVEPTMPDTEQLSQLQTQMAHQKDIIRKLQRQLQSVQNDHSTEEWQAQIRTLESQLKQANRNNETELLRSQVRHLERQLRIAKKGQEASLFQSQLQELARENRKLLSQNTSMRSQISRTRNQSSQAQEEVNRLKNELARAQSQRQKVISQAKNLAHQKNNQSQKLSSQVQNLERKLASASSVEDELKNIKHQLSTERQSHEQKIKSLNALTAQLKKQIEDERKRNIGNQNKKSFLAFMINWSSKEHDIDLRIEDPAGRRYNFKKREYPGHSGQFTLDTRRGPGAELWQSDNLTPGRYKVTYFFFNQYGNVSKASVFGTIFTPQGSRELPPVKMDMSAHRTHEFYFQVDQDGRVQIEAQ